MEYQKFNAFVADYSRDISRGGLFVKTEEPLPEGEQCFLTLTFPHLPDPITLNAEVSRTVAPTEGAHPGMGLVFRFADEQEQVSFSRVVDHVIIEQLGSEMYRRLNPAGVGDSTSGRRTMDASIDMSIDSLSKNGA